MTDRQPLAARVWGPCYRTWWWAPGGRNKKKAKRRSARRERQRTTRELREREDLVDARAALAREQHTAVARLEERARQHRSLRDSLIRQLRREDPGQWTYSVLAETVGCSPELIAHIMRTGNDGTRE